ncbi:MAG: hypothetical protein ACE5HL_12775 [Terriglobia bacterium]
MPGIRSRKLTHERPFLRSFTARREPVREELRGQGRVVFMAAGIKRTKRGVEMLPSAAWAAGLMLTILAVSSSTSALAQEAPRPAPADSFAVEVTTKAPPVRVHRELGEAQIRALSGKREVVGSTQMTLTTKTRLDTTFVSTSRGERSFWVSEVNVTLWYRAIDIYVAREHPQGSCKYRAILAHEREHIRVDREVVEGYADQIKAALLASSLPTYAKPLPVGSAAAGMKATQVLLDDILQPLQATLREKRRQASQALDTPETYEVFRQRCAPQGNTGVSGVTPSGG